MGLKNKEETIKFVIDKFEAELLEPELRPEYIDKLKRIEKMGKFKTYKNINELRKCIENA